MTKGKMYLGPSRPYGLPLMCHAVILDTAGVAGLDAAMKEHPELDKMMVDITKIPEAQAKIADKGSALNRAYEKIKAETLAMRGGK